MKTQINTQFIIRADDDFLPDNIIGVAVYIHEKVVGHSGIFIRYNSTSYLFHFDERDVLLQVIPKGALVFFKQLSSIPEELITSTYHLFTRLAAKISPHYGYFYSGGFYDETTLDFIDANQMPEIMSCVGFCLNVLKTVFLGEDLLQYTDWYYHDLLTEDDVLRYFNKARQNYPDIDIVEFAKHVRRILPIEYFTAGFGLRPVSKAFTDSNKKEVERLLMSKIEIV